VTLDNGLSYFYTYDKNKDLQNFIFSETKTRYIKLDVIRTSNGYIDPINLNVANNIARNILVSEITYVKTASKIDFSIPAISTIA
jgi:hypothetical protein